MKELSSFSCSCSCKWHFRYRCRVFRESRSWWTSPDLFNKPKRCRQNSRVGEVPKSTVYNLQSAIYNLQLASRKGQPVLRRNVGKKDRLRSTHSSQSQQPLRIKPLHRGLHRTGVLYGLQALRWLNPDALQLAHELLLHLLDQLHLFFVQLPARKTFTRVLLRPPGRQPPRRACLLLAFIQPSKSKIDFHGFYQDMDGCGQQC